MSVRIPADVDREDRILAGFTARQVAVMAVTGLLLYGGWQATRAVIPVIAYVAVAVPIGVAVSVLVVVRRDGVTLDRLLLAALRQRLQPRRRVVSGQQSAEVPEWLSGVAHGHESVAAGGLDLPAHGVAEAGIVDLGDDGVALVAACSTVNFALRTPAEQEALTAAFGRYLHSLGASVQILIRAQRLDLSGQIAELRERAAGLPHPALESAALDHADYLLRVGRLLTLGGGAVCRGRVFRRQDENRQVTRPPTGKTRPVLHRNAPLSAEGRRRLIQRCQTRPIAHVAAEMGLSRQCASKWVNRYRRFGDLGLHDRPSTPHRQPKAIPARVVVRLEAMRREHKYSANRIAFELAHDTVISRRTVTRHLRHLGLQRRRFLDPTGAVNRTPSRIIARRPGHMVHLDVKKAGLIPDGGGWRAHGRHSAQNKAVARTKQPGTRTGYTYLHSAVDGYSRLAYTEALPDEKARTAIGFLHRARAFFAAHGIARIQRIVTDNGSCYRAADFATALHGAQHQRTQPYTPRHNGKVERYQRILAEELLYARTWTSENQRRAALKVWNLHYNYHRPHTAAGGQPPASRLHTGVTNLMTSYNYLAQLGQQADLLRRQILLVVREPVRTTGQDSLTQRRRLGRSRGGSDQPSDGARKAAASRLLRRMSEATELLSPAGISVTPLDAAQATAVLSTATNPDSPLPPSAEMAGAGEVITTPIGSDWDLDTEEDFS